MRTQPPKPPPRAPGRSPLQPGPPPQFLEAVKLHQAGKLREAEGLYRDLLRKFPKAAEVHGLLGYLTYQKGEDEPALALVTRAIELNPKFVDAHLWKGMTLQRLERTDEALAAYRQVLALNSNHVDALNNMGGLLLKADRLDEAINCFSRAASLRKDRPETYYNLGYAYQQQRRFELAEQCYKTALELQPRYFDCVVNLSVVLTELNRYADALDYSRLAIGISPHKPQPHFNLGKALDADGHPPSEVEAAYRAALEVSAEYPDARHSLASLLHRLQRRSEAIEHLRYLREVAPSYLPAASSLAMTLCYDPDADDSVLREAHVDAGRAYCAAATPIEIRHHAELNLNRRLRIGYVSPDFRSHSVAFFLEPLLAAHDRQAYELFAYANVEQPDAVTERFRQLVDHWRPIAALDTKRVCQLISTDRIDILIDLAGHTDSNRLDIFAAGPAPIQGTWLGYPGATGLSTIDFRLVDEITDPIDDNMPTVAERLIRLPDCAWCYRPPIEAPEPRSIAVPSAAAVVFGCYNNALKLNPSVAQLWAEIVAAVPGSKLKIRSRHLESEEASSVYRAMFTEAGLPPAALEMVGWAPTLREGLAGYSDIDIALDPFPYNGTTTTLEALWMGVPVVTLRGQRHAGRVGASLLSAAGLNDLIAEDRNAYIRIATDLARASERRLTLRKTLREMIQSSPLRDERGFARKVENVYRELWKNYCSARRQSDG